MSCSLGHHCSSISVSQRTMELATQEEPAQWVWAETGTFPKCVSAILWLGQPSPNRPPPSPTFFFPPNKTEHVASAGIDTASKPNVTEAAAHSSCSLPSWTTLSCSGLYSGLRTSRPCAVLPANFSHASLNALTTLGHHTPLVLCQLFFLFKSFFLVLVNWQQPVDGNQLILNQYTCIKLFLTPLSIPKWYLLLLNATHSIFSSILFYSNLARLFHLKMLFITIELIALPINGLQHGFWEAVTWIKEKLLE